VRWLLLVLAALTSSCTDEGCDTDQDCKADRVCDARLRLCVDPKDVDMGSAVVADPDLRAPAADLTLPPPDAAVSPPDMARCIGTGLPCAGMGTVCDQDERCQPCGKDGQECCSTITRDRICETGLRCVGCSAASWGKFSRCQADSCGMIGKSCCWKWDPRPELCGAGGPQEWCIEGTCTAHRCTK
jgi:hypothetical protein